MSDEIEDLIYEMAKEDGQYAIAHALLRVAYQLKYLGNGNAATQMGAIEALGKVLDEGMSRIAASIMPTVSRAEQKMMFAIASGAKPKRRGGPSRKVAQEFVAADHRRGKAKLPKRAGLINR